MKSKKFLLIAFAVATPAILAPIQVDAEENSKTFKDVPRENVYYEIIQSMAEKGVISGYEDGTFKPSETITRKHASALINRVVDLPKRVRFTQPKDMSTSNVYFDDIKALMNAGLLQVDRKGNINPNAKLTRGEMAKILTLAFNLDTTGTNPLKDISSTYKPYVTALYNSGITTGFEDNTFREKESITRAHYAVFMYRTMNREDVEGKPETEEEKKVDEIDIISSLVMTDIKMLKDIPLPNGYTDAEVLTESLAKEYSKIFKEKGFGANSATLVVKRLTSVESSVKKIAEITNKSVEEVIELYNQAFLTGKVIISDEDDPVPFALYFDYKLGLMHFGYRNN